jgi:hypothetical protein
MCISKYCIVVNAIESCVQLVIVIHPFITHQQTTIRALKLPPRVSMGTLWVLAIIKDGFHSASPIGAMYLLRKLRRLEINYSALWYHISSEHATSRALPLQKQA